MRQYHDLLKEILEKGHVKTDRTGVGTISRFGTRMEFDLSEGFPLVTTKKLHTKSIFHELLWFLRGETNIRSLVQAGVGIWTDWPLAAYNRRHREDCEILRIDYAPMGQKDFERKIIEDDGFAASWGDLGPVYGAQWRRWQGSDGRIHDQIDEVVNQIRNRPDSRRIILSGWNVGDLDRMALPACHTLYQWDVTDGRLNCQLYQRSADTFLGVPFNIASCATLSMMLAQVGGLEPGRMIWVGGDTHIYVNHREQVEMQLSREPFDPPKLAINPAVTEIDDFRFEDFTVEGYRCHPAIRAEVAV